MTLYVQSGLLVSPSQGGGLPGTARLGWQRQPQTPGTLGFHLVSHLLPLKTHPVLEPSSVVPKVCIAYWKRL